MYQGGDPEFPLWIGEFGKTDLNKGLFAHGSFYSTQIQTKSGTTLKNTMYFNTTDTSQGVSMVSSSRITVDLSGTYNIQFSAQFDKTDSGNDNADVWLSKNGTNIPNSNTRLELDKNNMKLVAAWNWFVKAKAKDYFQINWSSADIDMRIYAEGPQSGPTRPGIPSVILTVNQIA
jgi:alpha-galactosidase